MNRNTYQATRKSIRTNGLFHTAKWAIEADKYDTLFTIDEIANVMKQTDWLAMRQQFARNGSASSAFKLTTTSHLASSV